MKKKILLYMCILSTFFMISGCKNSSKINTKDENKNQKIVICTSFYPMYDFVSKIGGDKVEIHNLVRDGIEPHDYEPTLKDIKIVQSSNLIVYNGAGIDDWMKKIINSSENKNVVEATKDITLLQSKAKEENLQYDPHVWLSPVYAQKEMENIKNSLIEIDNENANYYERNYEGMKKEIENLDKEYKEKVATFSKKDIVVAHQAFSYLCNAYNLKQVAIEGVNANSEPTLAKMKEITDFARKNNVKYIFFESLISPKVSQVIAKEIGAQTEVLNPLEGLTEQEISEGKEYFSIMRENLIKLEKALK